MILSNGLIFYFLSTFGGIFSRSIQILADHKKDTLPVCGYLYATKPNGKSPLTYKYTN